MPVDVFLNFNGNCREAVDFYAEVFTVDKQPIMTFGDAPPNPQFPLPEQAKNLIMFTHLNINGSNVMLSDAFPGIPFVVGNNINLTINSKNKDEISILFQKLSEGGSVDMPLQETTWSNLFGSLTDKFGIPWQFNYVSGDSN